MCELGRATLSQCVCEGVSGRDRHLNQWTQQSREPPHPNMCGCHLTHRGPDYEGKGEQQKFSSLGLAAELGCRSSPAPGVSSPGSQAFGLQLGLLHRPLGLSCLETAGRGTSQLP